MSINVTAATGHLGQLIVKELLKLVKSPDEIIVSVRDPKKAVGFEMAGVTVRQADYEDFESLIRAFQATETLMIIPSMAPVEPRIIQHYSIIEAAKKAGVKRAVFAGFMTAIADSPFTMAPFLLYAESKLRQSGLDWTILRNGMYSDPLVDYAPEIVKMGRVPYPAGNGSISYISREDIARATAAVCIDPAHAGRIYELTGPEALSVSELAGILSRVTGKTIKYEPASDQEFADMCREPGVKEYFVHALVSLYKAVEHGDLGRVTDHVLELTGTPPEKFESYLERKIRNS